MLQWKEGKMHRKALLGGVIVLLVLAGFTNSSGPTSGSCKRQAVENSRMIRPLVFPQETSRQQADLAHANTQLATYEKGYCVIQNDHGTPFWYYAYFDSGEGFAVHMDPGQCGADSYPFQITEVHFHLYDPDGYKWPAEIQVNIKDLVSGDKCLGPGDDLYSEIHSIPGDSAYPVLITLSLSNPFYVYQPFFLEIIYRESRDPVHPHPSLLMDSSVTSADTCNNWVRYQGAYYEWSDFWVYPPPGNAIMRAAGYAGEPCTTTTFTHLDTLWVPWGKVGQFTDDKALLGFRIDCVEAPDYLESVTIESFITRGFSVDTVMIYAEANGIQGLQAPGDTKIGERAAWSFPFDRGDTLKLAALHYPLDSITNKFYLAINAYSDSVGANPSGYHGQLLEAIIRPGRIVLNSGKTNTDSVYNRPYGDPGDDSTGFCPDDPNNPGHPDCRYRLVFDTKPCVDLPLHPGWQWISTGVDPDPCEMESIFVGCWTGHLDIVKACDGSFCIPGVGCWIDCWNVCEMYTLHMAGECTVPLCGSKVPTDKPCPLPSGWNCIAYFPECPLEPETALVSIWDNLDIVKNDDGDFCIPGVGCWIDCMEYNEGYKVHLAGADTLIYPTSCPPCPPAFAKINSFAGLTRTRHFSYLGNTGESYSIVINSVELNGKHPEVGDEIGIFTPSGLCVGGGVWQGGLLGIAAWQDDDLTEVVDGFQVGEQMTFKLWDKSENKEIELSAGFGRGDGRFSTVADPAFGGDAYALINLKGVSLGQPEKFELAQNYPNPFNPETKISYALPKDCDVKLTIYNIVGQKIKVLVDGHQTAGYKDVYWDGKDDKGREVASGIYFYKLDAAEFSHGKRMVLLK